MACGQWFCCHVDFWKLKNDVIKVWLWLIGKKKMPVEENSVKTKFKQY